MNETLSTNNNLLKRCIKFFKKFLFTILQITMVAAFTGIYIGRLFFGESGAEVYMDLSARCEILSEQIEKLNNTNARLQKEYFELKSIQGN